MINYWYLMKANPYGAGFPRFGEVDIVCGGPPCQGFSKLNRHKGTDESATKVNFIIYKSFNIINNFILIINIIIFLQRQYSQDFFDVALYFEPKYIVFENVAAFISEDNGGYIQQVVASLLKKRYQVRFTVMRAAAFGVPQKRHR